MGDIESFEYPIKTVMKDGTEIISKSKESQMFNLLEGYAFCGQNINYVTEFLKDIISPEAIKEKPLLYLSLSLSNFGFDEKSRHSDSMKWVSQEIEYLANSTLYNLTEDILKDSEIVVNKEYDAKFIELARKRFGEDFCGYNDLLKNEKYQIRELQERSLHEATMHELYAKE